MNTRIIFSAAAVVGLVFGLGLILAPTSMAALYGTEVTPALLLLDRYFGSTLLAFALMNWLARDMDYAHLRPILAGNLAGDIIGGLVTLAGTLGGVMNSLGWVSFGIYLLLVLGFAYLYFMGQPVSTRVRA